MSTKTIAVDSKVYERLAAAKHESESFSKAISRLLDKSEVTFSCGDILKAVQELSPLSDAESEIMLNVVRENRQESWPQHDLS
jgi:predicted CopG family antitoxin